MGGGQKAVRGRPRKVVKVVNVAEELAAALELIKVMEPQIKQMQSDWVKREETNYTDTILRLEKALEEKTRMHAKLAGIERRAEAKLLEAAKTSEACMAELAATSATALEASTLALVHLGESETKKFNIAIAAKQRMITARDVKIELLQGTVSTCKDEAQAVLTAHAEAITELDAVAAQRLSTIRRLSGKQGGARGLSRTDDELAELPQSTGSSHKKGMADRIGEVIGEVGTDS